MTAVGALRVALGIAILTTPGAHAAEQNSTERMITLLHTNDIHGHIAPWRGWEGDLAGKTIGGFDRLSTAIKQVRAEVGAENVLLLDAGDAIGDTMIADLTKGRGVLELMGALHYDAMTLGNHEPDFSVEVLQRYITDAQVPMLAANVTGRGSGKLIAKPFLVREVAGVKVGVLGLAYPNTGLTTAKKNVASVEFDPDSVAVAKRLIPQMRAQDAQVVVVVSHLGLGADKQLAEAVGDIDVIVGGHSHNRMPEALRVGHTLIVQAGAHASDLGRLDLTFSNGKIIADHRTLITLDDDKIASDGEMEKRMEAITRPFRQQLDDTLGEALSPIIRAQTLAGQDARKRDQQSAADSLFADILREETKSDIALLPGVGYGVAIQPGVITAEMLRNLIPHEGKVVTMTLIGAQVRQILEQAVENAFTDDPQRKVGGMIQVSGLRFSYDPQKARDQRVVNLRIGDADCDPSRNYKVATNSMLAGGGHNYVTFREGKNQQECGSQFEMVAAWIKQHKQVSAPTMVRIERQEK